MAKPQNTSAPAGRQRHQTLTAPPSGLEYPFILDSTTGRDDGRNLIKCAAGMLVALLVFTVGVPLLVLVFEGAAWLATGGGVDFGTLNAQVSLLQTPLGMWVRHLSLGMLTPACFALVVLLHRRQGRWLSSVQPGFRWRFGLLALGVAVVVLSLVLWASNGFAVPAWNPEPDWAWFLVAIAFTAPVQAAAEEFFFRGYLLAVAAASFRNKWVAVGVSALVFALFHGTAQNWALFADRLIFGALAGTLVLLTGGLEAAIAAHVANNLIAFSQAALTSSVASAMGAAEITWLNLVWDLGGYAVFAVLTVCLGRRLKVATTTP
jgi:membrane protease YdiL (CAAX protease family)